MLNTMSGNSSSLCFYDCSDDGLANATFYPYPDISGIGVSLDFFPSTSPLSLKEDIIGDCGLYGHRIHHSDDSHRLLYLQF